MTSRYEVIKRTFIASTLVALLTFCGLSLHVHALTLLGSLYITENKV